MARIIIPASKRQVSTAAPAQRIGQETFAGGGRGLQEIGKALNITAEGFQKAQKLSQVTEADTESRRRLIPQIRDEVGKGISLPEARNRFNLEFDQTSLISDFNIRGTLRKRQISQMQANLEDNISEMGNSFATVATPDERDILKTKLFEKVDENVRTGVITAKSGQDRKERTLGEWQKARIDSDIEVNPHVALQQLQLGNKGLYKDVDATLRLQKEKTANSKINRNEAIAKRNQEFLFDEKESELANRVSTGDATLAEIDRAELNGVLGRSDGVRKEFATSARKLLTSSKAPESIDSAERYRELSQEFVNLGIEKKDDISNAPFGEIANFRNKVIEAQADGLITRSTAEKWIAFTTGTYNKQSQEIVKSKFKNGRVVNNLIDFNSQRLPKEEQLEAFMFMDKRLNDILIAQDIPDDKIPEVAQKILKEWLVKKNPKILGLKEGQTIHLLSGSFKILGFDPADGEPIVSRIEE